MVTLPLQILWNNLTDMIAATLHNNNVDSDILHYYAVILQKLYEFKLPQLHQLKYSKLVENVPPFL